MSTSLLNDSLNNKNYDQYIDNTVNIFKLSSKESSILFSAKIENNNCLINLSIVNQDGKVKKFRDVIFECDDKFYSNFIDKLVDKTINECNIISFDLVNLDRDEFSTFRMIMENNDLFTIDGLTKERASHLLNLCESKSEDTRKEKRKYLNILNNVGIGDISVLSMMFVVLVLIFTLIVLILK